MKLRYNISPDSWFDEFDFPQDMEPNFDVLWNSHPKNPSYVRVFGKVHQSPRFEQSYGKEYTFSGVTHPKLPIPDNLQHIFDWANNLGYGTFSAMLVNLYENGHNYVAKHRDNESYLIPHSPILSISFGATRTFRIRDYESNKIIQDVLLPHGTVLAMGGKFNTDFTHEITKVGGKKGENVGRRINITFRQYRE